VIIQPHLPAPAAVPDPFGGQTAPGARPPAPRFDARDPLSAHGNSRLRRDPLQADRSAVRDRPRDDHKTGAHGHTDSAEVFGRSATSLFFTQLFAQEAPEEGPAGRPSVAHETAAAAYPSLRFDDDILLPGETVPLGWLGAPRLDILV